VATDHGEEAPSTAGEALDDGFPDAPTELLIEFARAGNAAGYPTAELEERVLGLADAFELDGTEVSVTPTLVDVSLGRLPRQRIYSLRVRPRPVDLDAMGRLDALVQDALDGQLGADDALARLQEVESKPLRRPWPVLLAAYALAGVALTPLLNGGWREAAAAALVGLGVGAIVLSTVRTARAEPMVAPIAAVAASFCAALLVELGFDASPEVVTLAALVTLLPGMTLTIGMQELSTQHLQSGVTNTASTLVQLLGLAFGVAVGRSIATNWFGPVEGGAATPSSAGIQLAGAVLAALAFTVTLRARSRDAAVMIAAACLAVAASEVGANVFGKEAAAFVAAVVIGVTGGLVGALLRRSALVFIVPGVLMLVPGSAGFSSVLQLLTDQTVSGITAGFDTFVAAMSIAYGLMVATVILPGGQCRRKSRTKRASSTSTNEIPR
jgi:uncharacterized membrane protein YjjP (DUF1212 family)